SIVDRFDQLQLPNSHHVWRAVQWLQFTPRRVDHYQVLGVCSMPRHAGRLLSTNSGLTIYSTRSMSHTPYPIGIPVRDIEGYSKLQLRIALANTKRQTRKRLTRYARLDAAYVCATMLPRQVEMQSIIKGQGEQDPAPDRRRSP